MNCLLLEQGRDRVVIDCGVSFATEPWGVAAYRPSFEPLGESFARLRAVVLTHGHEDHLGAIPALLEQCPVPVWGPPYALGLLRRKLAERSPRVEVELHALEPGVLVELGSLGFEPFPVHHSIADAFGLVIHSAAGLLVHSGDFKLDEGSPARACDPSWLDELADRGVRLLLADSTNSLRPGRSGGEPEVARALARVIGAATGRVVVGLFASNTWRLQALGEIARRHHRYLCPLGRSVRTHIEVARELGRWRLAEDGMVSPHHAREILPARLLGVATGTQGEPHGALQLLARGQHPHLSLDPGDTVVLSSRTIPGQERAVAELCDQLWRQGLRVHTASTDPALHVSGHAHRDELAELIARLRPSLLLPLHGSRALLEEHALIARDLGVASVVLDNGEGVELSRAAHQRLPPLALDPVAVGEGGVLSAETLAARRRLGRSGVVLVSLSGDCVRLTTLGLECPESLCRRLEQVAARVEAGSAEGKRAVEEALRTELRAVLGSRARVVVHLLEPGSG